MVPFPPYISSASQVPASVPKDDWIIKEFTITHAGFSMFDLTSRPSVWMNAYIALEIEETSILYPHGPAALLVYRQKR